MTGGATTERQGAGMDQDAAAYDDLVTVGCANFAPVWGDKEATLAKIEATIREAAEQGIDILVFPEKALDLGRNCEECMRLGRACPPHDALAETIPGPSTERVLKLAQEHDMYVVFGLGERDADDPTKLYNAAAFVSPEGILGSYRKLFLGSPPWTPEGVAFTPGDALPVWPTRWGPVGVLICYDFWLHPELARILALKGARLILNCTASFAGPGKAQYAREITEVRAAENVVYTASANIVGGPGRADSFGATDLDGPRELVFSGHSTIAGPAFPRFNNVYAEAGDAEELISATLSMTRLERWRKIYPWREWHVGHQRAASELVVRELTALLD
jgi:predicted amidohydrolase